MSVQRADDAEGEEVVIEPFVEEIPVLLVGC